MTSHMYKTKLWSDVGKCPDMSAPRLKSRVLTQLWFMKTCLHLLDVLHVDSRDSRLPVLLAAFPPQRMSDSLFLDGRIIFLRSHFLPHFFTLLTIFVLQCSSDNEALRFSRPSSVCSEPLIAAVTSSCLVSLIPQ